MQLFPVGGFSEKNYNAYSLIHHGILALGRAENVGMLIDVDYCKKQEKHLTRQIDFALNNLSQTDLARVWKKEFRGKVNFNSDTQLGTILYEKMGRTTDKKSAGGDNSTSADVLSKFDIEGIDDLLRIRKLSKARDTFLAGFMREQVNGVIHPFFNLHVPVTFRSSSDSPNFQNIPNRDPEIKKLLRKAIKPKDGYFFLFADYSGAEVRTGAAYHKDPQMLKYLIEGGDMHADVAIDAFKLKSEQVTKQIRFTSKNRFTFAEFYGDYYVSCAKGMWEEAQKADHALPDGTPLITHLKNNGIKGYSAFENHLKKVEDIFWNKRFKVYNQWKQDFYNEYLKRGFIEMYTGFRCSGLMSFNDCVNYPIQGSSFHCLLLAFVLLDYELTRRGCKSKLVAQIHDELIVQVHPDEYDLVLKLSVDIMEKRVPEIFTWLNVQIIAEPSITPINGSWFDKTDVSKITDTDKFLYSLL